MANEIDEMQAQRSKLEPELDAVQAELSSEVHQDDKSVPSAAQMAEKAQLESRQAEIEISLNNLTT